ncbi:MAG: hypothetical protein EA369_01430 [Bradymonadales bacterium]|nr:MAG: hypothetical protein EA369_01430 [Bradymonadales bacterium]
MRKRAETIEKMKELREKGYSYWKISEILNTLKVPPKTKKGRWHARTVQNVTA